jgi:copper(I)-binding protein
MGWSLKNKPVWMRVIEALTLIFAIIAVLSPFAAIILPAVLQALAANNRSELSVSQAWVRPINVLMSGDDMAGMNMDTGVTAAYMIVENRGNGADRLLRISTDAAQTAELHQTQVNDAGVARMLPQPEGIDVPPNGQLRIEPMGYHVMLRDLTRSLELGDELQLQLTFASGTVLDVSAVVSDFAP